MQTYRETAADILERPNHGEPASGARLLARLHREGFIVVHRDDIPHKEMASEGLTVPEALGWNTCRQWLIKHHGGKS